MYIKFNNSIKKENILVEYINNKLIKIYINDIPNLSGFKIYTDYNDLLGDYSDFITLYKQEKDGYILSNDGSVYVAIPEIEISIKPSEQELINAQLMREIAILKAGV